jgi:MoaA/NifB/PqqE/SkfB family radical SAM enzyme|tara:strand:- start:1007 stop:2020 length:1014 start_codon:yes stop_codon:yes gene_type:complete
MSYITTDKITSINAELTDYCNAACPMCARYFIDGVLNKERVNSQHTTLAFLKDKIGDNIVSQLKQFTSCGNLGDGAMNPECLEIYQWLRAVNPNIHLHLHSNGGARTPEFWRGMAKIKVSVTFAIDGLEDTNHLYRRNVRWSKLIENVRAFIDAGGNAGWAMLIFKHNESQIEQCRLLSTELGFASFKIQQSARWADFDYIGNWREMEKIPVDGYFLEKSSQMSAPAIGSGGNSSKINITKNDFATKKINCKSHDIKKNHVEIYLAANGDVSPCCWLGNLNQHESKNIIKDYNKVNLHHSTLEEILNGDYFQELEKGILGVENSYRLHTCYFTCGVK